MAALMLVLLGNWALEPTFVIEGDIKYDVVQSHKLYGWPWDFLDMVTDLQVDSDVLLASQPPSNCWSPAVLLGDCVVILSFAFFAAAWGALVGPLRWSKQFALRTLLLLPLGVAIAIQLLRQPFTPFDIMLMVAIAAVGLWLPPRRASRQTPSAG